MKMKMLEEEGVYVSHVKVNNGDWVRWRTHKLSLRI